MMVRISCGLFLPTGRLTCLYFPIERSIWRFKGPNQGSVQYLTTSQGLIQSQLVFEFNTTQSEGIILLTKDDNSVLKLDLKVILIFF
jgi:hypothetical protein